MGRDEPVTTEVRLTDLLAALSLGIDLGMGHPMEHVLRQTFIALRLADELHLRADERETVYYSSMLAWVGCHVDAYEQAKWFGDDQALKHDARLVDLGKPAQASAYLLRHIGAGRPFLGRVRTSAVFLGEGRQVLSAMLENHWRAAQVLIERLGVGRDVRDSVAHTFERWDGKGVPAGVRGEDVLLSSRLTNLADVVEVFHTAGGPEAAVDVARSRAGTQFDPSLVEVFCDLAPEVLTELDSVTSWDGMVVAEPGLQRVLSGRELDASLEAVADFVDLKSPFTLGHSRAVAELVDGASTVAGFRGDDATGVRRAALVHEMGRLGVSNAVWDKPGQLSSGESERVRMHPYLTERMLAAAEGLGPLAVIAAQHHERLDGSGYPRGLTASSLGAGSRLLAAADAYRGKTEPRPHRPAVPAGDAARLVRDEVTAGHLDGDAVEAVLTAAGHRARRLRGWPAGLTAREVEVLRLLARGLSHKQIAEKLVISRKTASNHVEHIYTKIGATNRAQASLFAVTNGLMLDDI